VVVLVVFTAGAGFNFQDNIAEGSTCKSQSPSAGKNDAGRSNGSPLGMPVNWFIVGTLGNVSGAAYVVEYFVRVCCKVE